MGNLTLIVLECKDRELSNRIESILYNEYGIAHISKNVLSGMYISHFGEDKFDEYICKLNSIEHKVIVIDKKNYTSGELNLFENTTGECYYIDSFEKKLDEIIGDIELSLL